MLTAARRSRCSVFLPVRLADCQQRPSRDTPANANGSNMTDVAASANGSDAHSGLDRAASTLSDKLRFVDEHEDARGVVTMRLSRRGYEVVAASSLITTLLISCGQTFHLYVLDAQFRGGTGIELCGSIREFDPLTPIIFFSSRTEESARREALEAGATDYVIKPDVDGLMETVSQSMMFSRAALGVVQLCGATLPSRPWHSSRRGCSPQ